MNIPIDFNGITEMLMSADQEDRTFLYEYEVYSLFVPIRFRDPSEIELHSQGGTPFDEELMALPGDKAVLKIVSPTIIHKTEVGGVKIVEKESNRIRSAVRRMLYEVPENYTTWIQQNPEAAPAQYKGLSGEALTAASAGMSKGCFRFSSCRRIPVHSEMSSLWDFATTREFGTVISAGLGGTDTELYAARFRKGQAIVAASTA